MLRYQPEIGPGLDSPLVRYLSLPVVPVQLGFDPRLQLLHADDATGAIEAAVANPVRGAGQRRPVGLDLAEPRAAAARPPGGAVPGAGLRAADGAARRASSAPAALLGDGVRLLRFGRGVDNRRLREEIGYEPRFDAAATIRGPGRRRRRTAGSARACIPAWPSPRGSGSRSR